MEDDREITPSTEPPHLDQIADHPIAGLFYAVTCRTHAIY